MKPKMMHQANIHNMYVAVEADQGFDVIIVVSSSRNQTEFWQERLQQIHGTVICPKTKVISVEEDWPGGAGQFLGTLYAFQKASRQINLEKILHNGGTIAMYHTAGKGTRMAPLPAAEANNKSAIKLPRVIEANGSKTALTVLEAVIFQTGIFAASRPGRLCVFWGDQVFIPSKSVDFDGRHHAEILDIRVEVPASEDVWRREWQSYGLIIPTDEDEILQREKQSWSQVQKLIKRGVIKADSSGKIVLGKSLGCFTVSHFLLFAMLEGSATELAEKKLKLDTDPHVWMPLTSDHDEFVSGGGDSANWKRVHRFKGQFLKQKQGPTHLFGDKDLGAETLWWDYGQVQLYHQNFLKTLEDSFEGDCLRWFYNLEANWIRERNNPDLQIENSILVDTDVKRGTIRNSVLVGVSADTIDVSGTVVMKSSLTRLHAEGAFLYDCIDFSSMKTAPEEVIADIFLPASGRIRMRTTLSRDGKDDWSDVIPGNRYSCEALSHLMANQPAEELITERSRWMDLYAHRDQLQKLQHGFIKPASDNLVEVVWGGDRIEQMKGLPPSNRRIGESWECSTHPQHPSSVRLDDGLQLSLRDAVAAMPEEILGTQVAQEFGETLPVLIKFLDAREDLSVQVHPSNAQAAALGETDTGKTEAWLVLDREPGAVLYLGFKEDVDEEQFAKDLEAGGVSIAEKYLNAIEAKVGDVLLNPPGAVHAVGKGMVLAEIQQSSGITYRVWDWNRIPKRQLHILQAMASLDFQKTTKADFELIPTKLSENEERLIDDFYFTTNRLTLKPGQSIELETHGAFQVLTCLTGKVELVASDSTAQLGQWESLLVPALLGSYRIVAKSDCILLKSFVITPNHIDPVIFQTYDVRAVANRYLFDRVCYYLGKGYGTFLRRESGLTSPTVTVGGGIRISTERIRRQIIDGILSTSVNVFDVGVTSTPELYFSIPFLNADGGVNITASHNEAEYNGLKQVIRSDDGFITSINADQMLKIKRTVLEGDFLEGQGQYTKIEEGEVVHYHNELVIANCRLGRELWIELLRRWQDKGLRALLDTISVLDFPQGPDETAWARIRKALDLPTDCEQSDTAIKHPFVGIKTVIDFGNGSAWRTRSVFSDLGAEVVALNDVPDGTFPAHIPDPIKAKYRKQLEEAVISESKKEQASGSGLEVVGIGNDEDADRVIYVRSDGRVVEGDRTLAIQAKVILDEHFKSGRSGKPRFLGEVKFSRVTEDYITANGGEYILSPTGFAFIKDGTKMLARALRAGQPEVKLFGRKINLRENKEPIALAAELSGHQMSGHEENWIFDDAILASTKVLSAIAAGLKEGKSFIDLDEAVPRYPATPEINIKLQTNVLTEKQEMVDKIVEVFTRKGYEIDTTDGGLIKWFDPNGQWLGQALIRKSNTQPAIIARVEGKDEAAKTAIEDEFFDELSKMSTKAIPQLNLASDDYITAILPRISS